MLLPGHAQVHVRVDEPREQVPSGPVDDLDVGVDLLADVDDLAAADQDVEARVEAGARVEHVRAADQDVGGGDGTVVEHQAGTGAEASAGRGADRPANSS